MKATILPALLSLALASMLTAQTCREVARDASGRIVQTIDRQKSAGGSVQTTKRTASGRITGTATTSSTNISGSSQTTYRDASGRLTGSSATSGSSSGSFSGTQRDASGRLTGSSTGSGKCEGVTRTPVPPVGVKR